MKESQIKSQNDKDIPINLINDTENEDIVTNKYSTNNVKIKSKASSKSKTPSTEQLKKEIEHINLTTASNRERVPLIRLISPEENEPDQNNNENKYTNLNLNTQIIKKSSKEMVKIVAVPVNEAQSAIMNEIEELSIPFDLKAINNLANESFVELPTKLENEDLEKNEKLRTTDIAVLNYEYILLGCEQHKETEIIKIKNDESTLPQYVYFYTDTKTFVNIFEKRKIELQPLFHGDKLINAIILLKSPPNANDSEILYNMFGSGVPINVDRIKCYIQFKLELLLNFRNSIIDLKNGKYLCLKTIQFGKKNPKHDFRNSVH